MFGWLVFAAWVVVATALVRPAAGSWGSALSVIVLPAAVVAVMAVTAG